MSSSDSRLQQWQTRASRPLLDRKPWLSVWEEDVVLPNGVEIRSYVRATARDYAMVFALLADGKVPLVRQYKQGIGAPSLDLPAGYLDDPAEAPLDAAKRELREETGLVARRWDELGHLVIDTNRGDTRAHFFLARDVWRAGEQELDVSEAIELSFHTPSRLKAMVRKGEITSLASVACALMALQVLEGTG